MMRTGAWLESLASDRPVPGGGAAAALTGALACALTGMTAAINLRRQKKRGQRPVSAETVRIARLLRGRFLSLADADGKAFAAYSSAHTSAQRSSARRKCLKPPMAMSASAAELSRAILKEVPRTSKWLASDLKEAALLCWAAHEAAALNVLINLGPGDRAARLRMSRRAEHLRRVKARVDRARYLS